MCLQSIENAFSFRISGVFRLFIVSKNTLELDSLSGVGPFAFFAVSILVWDFISQLLVLEFLLFFVFFCYLSSLHMFCGRLALFQRLTCFFSASVFSGVVVVIRGCCFFSHVLASLWRFCCVLSAVFTFSLPYFNSTSLPTTPFVVASEKALFKKMKLQDLIEKHEQPSPEAFQRVCGKEKLGRLRCHGRTTTPTLLKRTEEIAKLKREHSDDVKQLKDKIQEMEKRRKEAKTMEGKIKFFLKAMLTSQNTTAVDTEAITSHAADPNSVLRSSTSTNAPNDNEMNNDDINEEFEDLEAQD